MIPFVDLTREYRDLQEDIDRAIERVVESGYFVLGDEVERFETEFAAFVGARHGIGVNSGTDALRIALDAIGVGSGDEVITVSHSFVSTANAIVKTGAKPVFVDVDSETCLMDPAELEAVVSEATAAIVPVHLYGQPVRMESVMEVAERHDLAVVEDACQAHGARYRGDRVGTIGDVGCFSFYPTKNLGAYGDGGAIVTNDSDLAEELRIRRNVGQVERYQHETIGANSRLDELQAAILRAKLPHLEKWNDRRRDIASQYRERLEDTDLTLPVTPDDGDHVYHLFVVQHERRDELRNHLESAGVQTLIHYPVPIHEQSPYRHLEARSLGRTERIADRILSLPMFPYMVDDEVDSVVESIRKFD